MVRAILSGLRQSGRKLIHDDGPLLAGALAFFMALSLAPLIVMIVTCASSVVDATVVKAELLENASTLLGVENARLVHAVVERVEEAEDAGVGSLLIGVAAILFGATTVFVQLRTTLNRLWGIPRPTDERLSLRMIGERLTALMVVLTLGVLLVVSALLTVTIASLERWMHSLIDADLHDRLPQHIHGLLHEPWHVLDLSISLGAIGLVLTAVFTLLSDARVRWRDAALGAAVTTVLITAGNRLFGLYVGHMSIGSAFGAGSAVFVLLVWLYVSSLAVLFGAEVVWVRAQRAGAPIEPEHDDHWRTRWHRQRWRRGRRRQVAPAT